ncbi:hypothetical protein [Xanthomonas maliensis]|uniref:hypothetical protein n=1 Tax=Xanthomonas maliensis TaxID=1321368 RepID=UPI0003AAE745|nr:hypothetical protein [Xanthomonas maliensis]KAB7769726.1 hypothetical protein CKY51_06235 [Xanthomonas maliensis]
MRRPLGVLAVLALLLGMPVLASTPSKTVAVGPSVIGPGMQALQAEQGRQCPSMAIDRLAPADLLDAEERFRDALSAAERQRLDRQLPQDRDGPARCAQRNGASCPGEAYLEEIAGAGLMPRFVARLCAADTAH